MQAHSLTTLAFSLNRARAKVAEWKKAGGDLNSLSWQEVNKSLATASVSFIVGDALKDTSMALIRVIGDIAPHKHLLSSSAGALLGPNEGFAFSADNTEILLDGLWCQVKEGDLLILSAGTAHGFRGVGTVPLYALFFDSPPIDDAKDHVLVDV